MKKIVCSVLCLILLCALAGCSGVDGKKYDLTVTGGEYLIETLDGSYCAGEEVKVKTGTPLEGDYEVYLDEIPLVKAEIKQGDTVTHCEYTFIMPNREATLKIEWIICGDPVNPQEPVITETQIYSKVAYYSFNLSGCSGLYTNSVVSSSETWNYFKPNFPDFECDYDEQFFKENALIIIVADKSDMGGSFNSVEVIRQQLAYTWGGRDNLVVKVNLDYGGGEGATAIAKWALIIEVNKKDCFYDNLQIETNFTVYYGTYL